MARRRGGANFGHLRLHHPAPSPPHHPLARRPTASGGENVSPVLPSALPPPIITVTRRPPLPPPPPPPGGKNAARFCPPPPPPPIITVPRRPHSPWHEGPPCAGSSGSRPSSAWSRSSAPSPHPPPPTASCPAPPRSAG